VRVEKVLCRSIRVTANGADDVRTVFWRTTGPRSAIVNEAFVKRYLTGRNPLGARICQGSGPDAQPNIEIVGVVAS
jgi:hypothetical protein